MKASTPSLRVLLRGKKIVYLGIRFKNKKKMNEYQKQTLIKAIDNFLMNEDKMSKEISPSYALGFAIGIMKVIKEELTYMETA